MNEYIYFCNRPGKTPNTNGKITPGQQEANKYFLAIFFVFSKKTDVHNFLIVSFAKPVQKNKNVIFRCIASS